MSQSQDKHLIAFRIPILFIVFLIACGSKKYCYNQKDCFNKTSILLTAASDASGVITFRFLNRSLKTITLSDTLRFYYFEDNFYLPDTTNKYITSVRIGYKHPKLAIEKIFKNLISINPDSTFQLTINKVEINETLKSLPKQSFEFFYISTLKRSNNCKLFHGMLASNYIRL